MSRALKSIACRSEGGRYAALWIAACGICAMILAVCSPIVAKHGIEPDPVVVDSLVIGQTTQLEISNAFGSPMTDGTFRPDVWYYIFQRTEALGFLKPDIVYQRIYAFDFDDQGLLENIFTLTEADGKDIEMTSRVTPTRGTESNVFKEIFGNVGRFVGDDGPAGGTGPRAP